MKLRRTQVGNLLLVIDRHRVFNRDCIGIIFQKAPEHENTPTGTRIARSNVYYY